MSLPRLKVAKARTRTGVEDEAGKRGGTVREKKRRRSREGKAGEKLPFTGAGSFHLVFL
jgi:hypothetical protein